MMTPQSDTCLTDLFDLLEQERRILVTGDLEGLRALSADKERLIDLINMLPVREARQMEQLQDKLSRNQQLLNSALEGIRAVAHRMAELRKVRQGLETYDHTGQRSSVSVRLSGKLEKRA